MLKCRSTADLGLVVTCAGSYFEKDLMARLRYDSKIACDTSFVRVTTSFVHICHVTDFSVKSTYPSRRNSLKLKFVEIEFRVLGLVYRTDLPVY